MSRPVLVHRRTAPSCNIKLNAVWATIIRPSLFRVLRAPAFLGSLRFTENPGA